MSDQRHPYASHPAALVLADHQRLGFTRSATDPAVCDCGWRGALCDHPAHLAEVLHRAGLLADGPPPETLTERILAERATRGGYTPGVSYVDASTVGPVIPVRDVQKIATALKEDQ